VPVKYYALLASAALVLGGCGGGHSALPPASPLGARATAAPAHAAGATLSVVIPHPLSGSRTRRPAYVSPSSAQLLVGVNGGATTTYGLSATSPGCSVIQSNTTCTFQIPAAAGNDAFALTIEDAAGNVLSQNVVSATLAPGVATPVNVTLAGIPASVLVVPGSGSGIEDTANPAYHVPGLIPESVELEALDADGNVIVGPGAPTIGAPSITTGSSYATIASAQTTDPNAYILKATGGSAGGQTIAVSASAQSIPLSDGTQSAPVTSGTNFLFTPAIATATGPFLFEYSVETGAQIAQYNLCPGACATTFATGAASDANGDIFASYEGIAGISTGYSVAVYPPNAVHPAATLSSAQGVTGAVAVAVSASGMLYVANEAAGFFPHRTAASITEYAAGDRTSPTYKITGAALTGPVAIAVDGSGNVYLANSDGTIAVYSPGSHTTPTNDFSDPNLPTPQSMAVDTAGDIYAFDSTNMWIAYFPAGTTSVTQTLQGSGYANFAGGMAFDGSGDLILNLGNELQIDAASALPNNIVIAGYINGANGYPAWIP
jgi:hypothetical protein